ncbi:MAG: hypothetical protein IKM89_05795 [Bacteroidales bacterium]|nr:hypothetical protein [Bacteroidales bacterium]
MRSASLPRLAACLLLILPACRDRGGRAPEWETALKELDRSLAREPVISQAHKADLADLKIQFKHTTAPLARYRLCDRIFDGYLKYDVDSALRYAHLKEAIAADTGDAELRMDASLDLAQRYLISGMYHTALEAVGAVDTAAVRSTHRLASYYQTLNSIYHGMALAAKDPELSGRFRAEELLYQQRSRAALTEDMLDYYTVNAGIEIENGHPERARQLMTERLADERLSLQDQAIVHYWIAKTYREEGNRENELKHYAVSANCDQMAPVKASRSLIRLSRILYDRGDLDRAYTYIVRAYEDATRSDARTALDEINQSQPDIIAAYEKLEQRRQRQLKAFLAVTILILAALGFALLRLYRNHKRIGRMQRQILENVERLKESNQIKDTYLGRYLSMFSEHIDALERYRSGLRVTAKSKDLDDILRVLKSDAYIDMERKTLYDEFDATFLGVFPDFVNQLNGLLREEGRIGQDLPPGKLSNELRIFALIRLGVTESAQIARFLKKSPSTVYNYRVKLRNAAACDRDEFEKRLMEIGNPG